MLRKRWLVGVALLAAAAAGPARAQERTQGGGALAMVPEKAPMVIAIRGLKGTSDRVLKMAQNAIPTTADKVKELFDEGTKKIMEGRGAAVKALAPDGPIFVALNEFPEPGSEPNMTIIARVTDYKAFRDGFLKEEERKDAKSQGGIETVTVDGKKTYLLKAGDYAVLSTHEDTAKAFAAKKVKGLDKRLDAGMAKQLVGADVGVYIDMGVVLEKYADQIRQAQDQVKDALDQAEQIGGGKVDKAQMKLAKTFIDAGFRTVQDSRSLIYTATFAPDGLNSHISLGLAPGSATAKQLKGVKPSPLTGLGKLPARALSYSAMEFDPQTFKLLQPLVQGIFAEENSDEAKKVKKALEQLVAAGPHAVLQSQAVPASGLAVSTYDDPAKALDASLQLLEAVSKNENFRFMPLKDGLKVKRKARNYRGTDWSEVTLKWDLDKMFADVPFGGEDLTKGMEKMIGKGENIFFGVQGKNVIAATAKDWDAAKKMIDDYLDQKGNRVGGNEGFEATRKHLPAETTMLNVIDFGQYLDLIVGIVQPMMKAAGQDIDIPRSKEKEPGYVGFAMTLQPRSVGIDVFFSGRAAREVYRVLDPFLKKFGGGGI